MNAQTAIWMGIAVLFLSVAITHPRTKVGLLVHGICRLFGIRDDEPDSPQNVDRSGNIHGLAYRRDDHEICWRCKGTTYDPDPDGDPNSEYRPSPELDASNDHRPTGKFFCRQCGGYGELPKWSARHIGEQM